MATQTIEFAGRSGQTGTAYLFSAGSDTVVSSAAASAAVNRKSHYTAAFTDVPAGTYLVKAINGSGSAFASGWVTLTLTTSTFQVYDFPFDQVPHIGIAHTYTQISSNLDTKTAVVVISASG